MSFGSGSGGGFGFGSNNNTTNTFGGFGNNNNNNTANTSTGFGNAGSTTSAFGGNSGGSGGLFGSNASGGTAFGNTGSGFGASTSGFGQNKPAFGSSTGGGGLFGSTPTTTASGTGGFGFGGNQTTTATSSPFGGGSGTSLFGNNANKPSGFGGTTTGTTGGLFGGGGGGGTTSSFGSTGNAFAPASTALGGPIGDPPGTATTPFNATVEKESATSSAQNSFQNILFQDPYKKWSAEELRLVDYNQGRRFGTGAGSGFGGGSTFGGGFGGNTAATTTTNAFGSSSTGGGLFGSNNNTTNTGFGAQNNTATTGTGFGGGGLFGQNKPATGGLFGSSTSQPAQSGGLFGTSNNTGGFGNTGATNTGFGAAANTAAPTGGLFGGGAAQTQNKFGFGTSNSTTTGTGFGAPANTGGFGNNAQGQASGGLFGSANTQGQASGGLFGNNNQQQQQQQQQTGTGFGSSLFGNQNQAQNNQPAGGGLFANNANKPAGGLFGGSTTTTTGGGLFGNAQQNNAGGGMFGQANNQAAGGGLFNKPASTGMFGSTGGAQTQTQGGGLFGGLGQNQNPQQQQQAQGGGLFGSLGQNQPKPSLFGGSTQSAGGGLFGSQNNQQANSMFGSTQQQPQNAGNSMFGGSMNQPAAQSLSASVNDPSAFGTSSLFGNLSGAEVQNPGPLATPLSSKKQARRPSILPQYKLNPASASRFATPQKRGFGFSYSTYGTPTSPSSVASTPGGMSQSLLGGSLSRSLSKSVSTSSLRRSFNVEDSLLAPGAFSTNSGSRFYGSNNVKKLVINRELRSDLFSTPPKEKALLETPSGSRKLNKRVSFDTNNVEAIEDGDATNGHATPTAEDLGYIRPAAGTNGANGVNGAKPAASATPEMEQVKGNELAIVHEEEVATPAAASPSSGPTDKELGDYWMSPSKEEIQNMNRVQRQRVTDFTVGRENAGWVKFLVPVDLSNIDLDHLYDEIVVFEIRSCTVYPNPAKKPAMGKGLNVPALITLENSWPRNTQSKKSSRSKAGTPLSKHIERLKRIENTKFENYNAETGEWSFTVEHFTTYGLDYDSEDEETEAEATEPTVEAPAMDEEPVTEAAFDDDDDTFDFRQNRRSVPGALPGTWEALDDAFEEEEAPQMTEVNQPRSSFLSNRSAGSPSNALIRMDQDDMDEEYAMSEEQEDASASLGHHLAAEPMEDSFAASHMDMVQETPAGIMRARMRAIKETATPMKVQVAAGDDWMDMLQKTISPQKRDRALLKNLNETENYLKESVREKSPAKKRIVSDGRGFATSIDLMNSLFEKAKAPTENLQASVRPQTVKWPYKRVTKNLDEDDLPAEERAWHDTLRPTWGPNGTLVFAATPTESAFGRTGRITEKNGLMSVMKGAIVTESQDIRIAKFTNELSAKAIRAQRNLTQVFLDDSGVPTVEIPSRTSIKDFAAETGKNAAADHEKLVWELATVLFDNIKIPADLQDEPNVAEKIRRDHLSRFWEGMVESKTSEGVLMAASSEEKALVALSGHRVAEACKHLLDGKDFRLATLVALIGSSDSVRRDMKEQLKEWQHANALPEFSQAIRALYEMLSGNVCVCEGAKGNKEDRMDSFVISERFGLSWKQAFGLRLWYAISSEDDIAAAVERFQEDVAQDKEKQPITWFAENGIKGIWNDPKESEREDLLWGLLRLYATIDADLESILKPENSQLSPLDYRLTWQLGQALTFKGNVSFGKNADEKSDAATIAFAAQLTNEDSWLDATFVLLHLTDRGARTKAIQEHLCRHAGLIGNEQSDTFLKLTGQLKIPTAWVWHAKALYMRSVKKDPAAEVQCLLRAESFAEAHKTFVKEVAPLSIIERNYDGLADLLQQFEGRHAQVPDWNVGGEVYKAFLQLLGFQRRLEQPPLVLVGSLLEGLPAMHGNTPEAGVVEYAALTDMAAVVAKVVAEMAKAGQMDHERILGLPLTEDVLLKHSRDLAWSHYTSVMAGH